MAEQLRSFLRLKEVKAATGMSRSWLYEAIRRGDFPAPVSIGVRAVAWDSASIADWQESRISLHRKSAS
jgi:prophage regulatory protein